MQKPVRNPITKTGTDGPDTLSGTAGSDLLEGLGGNDSLNGGAGIDTTDGGTGDDWHFVDNAGDVVLEAAGEGNDRIFASASYVLAAGVSVETMSTTFHAGTDAINLTGNELANILYGNAGSNRLDGGGGADTLTGWAGDDVYYVDSAADHVIEAAGEGSDRVLASVSYKLAAGLAVELLTTTSNLGTDAINLTGNELANTIYGNDGANVLNGAAGVDRLVGWAGDDVYYVDNGADRVNEAADDGNDRVFASASFALGSGESVEMLTTAFHAGTETINLTGNDQSNIIFGNAGNNVLDGGFGGTDTMTGWAGDDTYYVNQATDRVIEAADGGNDRIYATRSYTLAAGTSVEILSARYSSPTTLDLTGNELANTIIGNNGENILDGKAGADTLIGMFGDDTYYVDNAADQIVEVGTGYDEVLASVSYTLAAGVTVERLSADPFTGTAAINLTGNAINNIIVGNDGDNILDGKEGADMLLGSGGADSFAFTTALSQSNADTISGVVSGEDKLLLDHNVFAGIGDPGALDPDAFRAGSSANDAEDRILYNIADGRMYFDADGNGSGDAVLFAILQVKSTLAASDFVII